jgi:uncharacterized protein (TIGR00255 family)
MIKSMTGYGRAEAEAENKTFAVELKTINSKQFDLLARIPQVFKEKELEIRTLLLQKLERGKVELTITANGADAATTYSINIPVVIKYYSEIRKLKSELQLSDDPQLLSVLLKMPEVLKSDDDNLPENEWSIFRGALIEALEKCDKSRAAEGRVIESDFIQRIELIRNYLCEIENFENRRIEKIREKFKKDLQKLLSEQAIDENRFEQEIIYYLEKIDITEEKVRLANHCDYFIATLDEKNVSNGKKLNFISQEIGREINTIGSKANDFDIQKLVVQMKDELEKIKEQLYNIL